MWRRQLRGLMGRQGPRPEGSAVTTQWRHAEQAQENREAAMAQAAVWKGDPGGGVVPPVAVTTKARGERWRR